MIKLAIVGCTGKLGSTIIRNALRRNDVEVKYAIARNGNQIVGKKISEIMECSLDLVIIGDIEMAIDCDVFVDCTNADTFMSNSYSKYQRMKKPLVIATTAFASEEIEKIKMLSREIPIFITGNFSVALHNFIETLKYVVKKMSNDTDIQIIEYHHNQKVDAPSGTALMIKEALLWANTKLVSEKINISSIRGGNIFGEHEVIFANCKDEVMTFKHQVSSRETFADGAIEVAVWLNQQKNSLYNMDDFCCD